MCLQYLSFLLGVLFLFFLDASALLFDFGKVTWPLHAICEASDNNASHAGVLRGLINVCKAWCEHLFNKHYRRATKIVSEERASIVMELNVPLFGEEILISGFIIFLKKLKY